VTEDFRDSKHQGMAKLSQFVRFRLAMQQRQLTDHPDANLMEAFAEQRLSARERAEIFGHLATCPECREVLSLAASADANTPAALSERERRPATWWIWRSAAAAVICLVTTVIWRSPLFENSMKLESTAKAVIAKKQPVVPAAVTPNDVEPEKSKPAKLPVLPKQASPRKSVQIPTLRLRQDTASHLSAKISLPEPPPQVEVTAQVPSSAAALDRAPDQIPSEPKPTFQTQYRANAAKVFASGKAYPRPKSMWTLGEATAAATQGTVQKSEDGGSTWQVIRVDPSTLLYALSAAGPNIWVGGADGKLFHSADDGLHWIQITVASDYSRMTESITKIDVIDEQQIRLKTSSGDEWVTVDGGLHWRR